MVKFTKSNWAKYGLVIMAILLIMGSLNNTAASSVNSSETVKRESLSKIENTTSTIQGTDQLVTEAEAPTPSIVNTSFKSAKGLALKIDAINLNIPLTTTTLGKNRELLVPVNANVAAWYKNGPKIGQSGTALITGHLDQAGAAPGVFYNLRKLKAGDEISARLEDGRVATYKVDKLESYAQDMTFPWNKVYSTSGSSQIRIITCDGTFNSKTGRYSRNLVVYASMTALE